MITKSIKIRRFLIFIILVLNIIGLLSLYSALHQGGEFKYREIFFRQVVWIFIGWIVFIVFSNINYRIYFELSIYLYILAVILLVFVDIFGKQVMGAQRWIQIFQINFQPSELAKISLVLFLSRILSVNYLFREKSQFKVFIKAGVATLLLCLLIFKQPDLGTAMILFFVFIMMIVGSNLKKRYVIAVILSLILVSPLGWKIMKPYQRKRIMVFLNPNEEPLGAGYTIIQSKIAIGSGRLLGKGFLAGTQNQFNFLPERHTDFIFTVVAEEWGLVGSVFLLLIYYFLLKIIINSASRVKDDFGTLICVGIFSIMFTHILINIGMTLGIFPVVGLPLIFISYGGTNLLVNYLMLGIFYNILKND